jgi:hypothetical protein
VAERLGGDVLEDEDLAHGFVGSGHATISAVRAAPRAGDRVRHDALLRYARGPRSGSRA